MCNYYGCGELLGFCLLFRSTKIISHMSASVPGVTAAHACRVALPFVPARSSAVVAALNRVIALVEFGVLKHVEDS